MKNINSNWLGTPPEHWKTLKLRQILRPFSEKNHADLQLLSVVREKGVIVRDIENDDNHNYIPDDLSNYKMVKSGQFAMNKMKAWQGSYGVSKYTGIVSPAYFVFDFNYDMNPDFFHYAIRSKVYVSFFGQASDGIRVGQWDLSIQRMKEIPFYLPTLSEQDQIVRFLDWKISEINRLINIKKKEIKELEELKNSIISSTVLHGVSDKNKNERWKKIRLGYATWIRARLGWKGLKASEYVDEGYPFLSAFNIVNNKLSWNNLNYINQQRYDESPEIQLSVGDILLVKDGAGIGKCARIDSMPFGDAAPNGSLAVVTPNSDLNYKYLYYYFISNVFRNEMFKIITGMGVPHLTQHFLKNVEIPCPPLSIQEEIITYLDVISGKIDTLIGNKKVSIEDLHEFRNRLVSDTVTGKIDVREIEIPEYEFTDESTDSDSEDADLDVDEEQED